VLSFCTNATVAFADDGSAAVPHPWERVLAAAADAGFRRIALDGFTLGAAERAAGGPEEVAERVRDLGLAVTDLSAFRLGPDAGGDERVATSMARRCAALGIPVCVLVVHTPPTPELDARIDRCADIFAGSAVRLALEFLPYSEVRTIAAARDVCGRVGFDRCGLLVDTWHLARGGGSVADVAALGRDEVACVQLADARPDAAADLADESRHARLLPGEGVVDFPAVAAALTAIGYRGALGTEVLSRSLREQPPEAIAEACFRAASAYFPA
jgi:sugar phosphate isomerase/epimerase